MRSIILLMAAVALTGCAAGVQRSMDAWMGRSEAEAVAAFGGPDRRYDMAGGAYVLTWERSRLGTVGEATITASCERELIFNASGTVTGGRWQGNDCRAISP